MLGTTPRPLMNFFNHITSYTTSLVAIYSDYLVKSVTASCLELLHVTSPLFSKNVNPDREREFVSGRIETCICLTPYIFLFFTTMDQEHIFRLPKIHESVLDHNPMVFFLGFPDNDLSCSRDAIRDEYLDRGTGTG